MINLQIAIGALAGVLVGAITGCMLSTLIAAIIRPPFSDPTKKVSDSNRKVFWLYIIRWLIVGNILGTLFGVLIFDLWRIVSDTFLIGETLLRDLSATFSMAIIVAFIGAFVGAYRFIEKLNQKDVLELKNKYKADVDSPQSITRKSLYKVINFQLMLKRALIVGALGGAFAFLFFSSFNKILDGDIFFASQYERVIWTLQSALWIFFLGTLLGGIHGLTLGSFSRYKTEVESLNSLVVMNFRKLLSIGNFYKEENLTKLRELRDDTDRAESMVIRFYTASVGAIIGAINGFILGAITVAFFVTNHRPFSEDLMEILDGIENFVWNFIKTPLTSLLLIALAVLFGLHRWKVIGKNKSEE